MVGVMSGDDGDEQNTHKGFATVEVMNLRHTEHTYTYTRAPALTLTLPHTLSHSKTRSHSPTHIQTLQRTRCTYGVPRVE